MQLINCGICWDFGNANRPTLVVHVPNIPDSHEVPHDVREVDGKFWYYGERDDYVHFCIHDPKNETGFSGNIIPILMKDKSIRLVRGPWSSNSVDMHFTGKYPWSLHAKTLVGCSVHGRWYQGHFTKKLGKEILKALKEKEEYKDLNFMVHPNHGLIIKLKGVPDDDIKDVMRKRFQLNDDYADEGIIAYPHFMKEE